MEVKYIHILSADTLMIMKMMIFVLEMNLEIFPTVDMEKYNLYIEKYIKINSSKNIFTWEIILENLFS